ncbi:hypothetical protein Acr_22g0008320 [Actinidia rufa]|uniref:Uncharacterized protein n=1 Tax=Actinidia rufa TaxID=165716 RepID=A0A7J0GL50_9ERIC|nr:hypothetical protein Acr_22g0008320 [Actinidia rufa]
MPPPKTASTTPYPSAALPTNPGNPQSPSSRPPPRSPLPRNQLPSHLSAAVPHPTLATPKTRLQTKRQREGSRVSRGIGKLWKGKGGGGVDDGEIEAEGDRGGGRLAGGGDGAAMALGNWDLG